MKVGVSTYKNVWFITARWISPLHCVTLEMTAGGGVVFGVYGRGKNHQQAYWKVSSIFLKLLEKSRTIVCGRLLMAI